MKTGRKCLTAAILSTIASAVWLADCVVEAAMGMTACGAVSGGMLAGVWAAAAAGWWLLWRRERRAAEK